MKLSPQCSTCSEVNFTLMRLMCVLATPIFLIAMFSLHVITLSSVKCLDCLVWGKKATINSYMHRNALLLFYSCRGWWIYRNRPFYLYGELAQSVKVFLVKTDDLSQKPHGEGESQLLQWFFGVLWKQINTIKQVKPQIAFSLPLSSMLLRMLPSTAQWDTWEHSAI